MFWDMSIYIYTEFLKTISVHVSFMIYDFVWKWKYENKTCSIKYAENQRCCPNILEMKNHFKENVLWKSVETFWFCKKVQNYFHHFLNSTCKKYVSYFQKIKNITPQCVWRNGNFTRQPFRHQSEGLTSQPLHPEHLDLPALTTLPCIDIDLSTSLRRHALAECIGYWATALFRRSAQASILSKHIQKPVFWQNLQK